MTFRSSQETMAVMPRSSQEFSGKEEQGSRSRLLVFRRGSGRATQGSAKTNLLVCGLLFSSSRCTFHERDLLLSSRHACRLLRHAFQPLEAARPDSKLILETGDHR